MISLAHASVLLLAPLGFLAISLASRYSAQPLPRARRIASLAVRCMLVLLLTFALGGPVFTRVEPYRRFTAFLLDVSESLPQTSTETALRELQPRWNREVAAGQRCALIAFAGHPQVLVPPSSSPLRIDRFVAPESLQRTSTDLARALETARSLFQEHVANRVVLLSDGIDSTRPTSGIDLPPNSIGIPLGDPRHLDVAIVDVQAPLAVRSGEPFEVRVTLNTNRACEFGLSAVMDEKSLPDATKRFSVAGAGRHTVALPALQQKEAMAVGLHRLLVMADAPGDAEPRNNVGLAAITVTGKPKILLVEGTPAAGEFISRILRAQDIDFIRQSPAELAPRAEALDEFVAVVLAGVPREAISAAAVAALRTYVEHTGGGLWVLGSPDLQGPRGYAGSELEKLLPVAFSDAAAPLAAKSSKTNQPPIPPPPTPPAPPPPDEGKPQKMLAPAVALMLIVDKSGSMAGRNIEIVKESCIATAEALSSRDVVGVIAFDYKPRLVLEFTEAQRGDYIKQRILRLLADGGTRIQPALVLALQAFELDPRAQRCAVKHAVLLSDGDAPAADYEPVVRRMAEEGITVSTVCVSGPSFDPVLMSQIASWGKGRFKFTNSFGNVPKLILQEAKQAIASIPKDEPNPPPPAPEPRTEKPPPPAAPPPPDPKPGEPPPFQAVVLKDAHEIFAGIDGRELPGLRGRLAAAARPKAEIPLATKEGQPVLALGRLGLGKTAVWTADLSGTWSSEWLKWKDSPKLFAQLLRYLSSSGPDSDLAGRVRVTRDGARALLRIDSAGPGGAIRVTDMEGHSLPVERDAHAEGIVSLGLDHPGEMRRLLLQREDGKKFAMGVIRAYDEEFAPADPSHNLFASGLPTVSWEQLDAVLAETRVTGEHRRDLAPWLISFALLILPLDVALRRVTAS
jgi:Ca-activated chloride channel family protein